MDKVKLALRWIAILPGSFLGAWIISIIFNFLEIVGSRHFADGPIDPNDPPFFVTISAIFIQCVGHFITGAGFLYIGINIAPSHKKQVAVILATAGIAIGGALVTPALLTHQYKIIFVIISLIAGIATCLWDFWHNPDKGFFITRQ